MSFDKFFPSRDVLARQVGIMGTPYHGPVQGDVLTLPNATTKAYLQPDDQEPDTACTAHLLKVPGIAEVSRTVDELAADAAAGRQWRNKAMLSGHRFQLYGQNLDGWVYIDSAGDRWLVKITNDLGTVSFNLSTAISIDLSFTRFGAFGKDADTVTRTVGLSYYGQPNAPFDGFPSGVGVNESITTASFLIDGIYSDGSKVALVVRRFRPGYKAPGQGEDVFYKHPLGWLEIAITGLGGDPTVTLSVLKTRDETLVVVDDTESDGRTAGAYPALAPDGIGLATTEGTYGYRLELLRLLAAWPDEATGGWEFVALRYVNTLSASGSVSGSGTSYTTSTSAAYDCTMTIEVGGAVQSTLGYTASISGSLILNSTGATPPAVTWTVSNVPEEKELLFRGASYTQTGPPLYEEGNAGDTYTVDLLNYGSIFDSVSADKTGAYRSTWRQRLLLPTTVLVPGIDSITVDVQRYSLKAFGFRYRLQTTPGGAGDFVHMPRVTPSGVQGSEVGSTFDEDARLYASWCPHTEVLTDLETTPICWV